MPQLATDAPAADFADWSAILELGRYAPTPHNTQWYFIHPLNSTTAKVCIDETIKLPFTDPDDQFRFTGLGVFVRHLELAAQATGFTLKANFNADDARYPVTVSITGRQPAHKKLADLIQQRQTSRLA